MPRPFATIVKTMARLHKICWLLCCSVALANFILFLLFYSKFISFYLAGEVLDSTEKYQIHIERTYNAKDIAFLPPRLAGGCTDSKCLSLLSKKEREDYDACIKRTTIEYPSIVWRHGECRFIDSTRSISKEHGPERGPVALASFAGSGNTWLRGLLELATSICTGSVYCHADFRTNGFTGEGMHSGSTLVVKTHEYMHSSHYVAAVFLIRNPYRAIVAERKRSVLEERKNADMHRQTIERECFGYNNTEWDQSVDYNIKWWSKMIQYWLVNSTRPVLIVKYEDMKQDPVLQVKRILHFLKYHHLTNEELRIKLKDGYNKYLRKEVHPINNITQLYTSQHVHIINHYIRQANKEILTSRARHSISLLSYLEKEEP